MKTKELRAQRARLIADARELINTDESAEAAEKFDAMMTEADGMLARIERIERAEDAEAASLEAMRQRGESEGVSADEVADRERLEASTYDVYLRRGERGMSAEQREIFAKRFNAAEGTSPDTAGGYVVPMGPMQPLVDAQKAYGGMLDPGVCYIFDSGNANQLPIPTDDDTSNAGALLEENTQVGEQDVTFGNVMLDGYTYTSKLVRVSNQLLQDSFFDLNGWLMAKLGVRIARAVNTDLTVGSGASRPRGIAVAATKGYDAGGSSTSGETATISTDDLIELEHSVDPAYRKGARFMMGDTALKIVKKLKDGIGRPLWLPGLATREPDTILQYPYTINRDMADPAASATSVLFGDFQNYYVRRIAGVQVLRLTERYADFNQVGFVAFQRWDGDLVDAGTHPVKYLKQAAS